VQMKQGAAIGPSLRRAPRVRELDVVDLVEGARSGDRWAWEELVRRFGALVSAVARRCRLNEADVAEVCQTTWLRLVENLDRIEQPDRLGAWLATTSRRESLRIATRRANMVASDTLAQMADAEAEMLDAGILKEEQAMAIRAAADKLPPRCRRLLGLLMGREDLSYKEISELLAMPVGSIGPTRGRCLEHLRRLLVDLEGAPAVART
jgi:RNA polymerase sigma factor (sigma-70 family)